MLIDDESLEGSKYYSKPLLNIGLSTAAKVLMVAYLMQRVKVETMAVSNLRMALAFVS